MNRLLLVFAHPDDESVFAAGTACRVVAEGGRVGVVTATVGDRGRSGEPPICAPHELGRVRQAELAHAAHVIGASFLRVLGYPDKGLRDAPADTIRRQLVEAIRSFRPQVVVTFDPNGSNLHPDHVAISRFASDAIAAAADARWFPDFGGAWSVQRLLWTLPDRPWRLVADPMFDPSTCPGVDFAIDTRSWSDRKAAALRAHRTQHLVLDRILLGRPDLDRLLSTELFRQAWGPPVGARPAGDVFEGVG